MINKTLRVKDVYVVKSYISDEIIVAFDNLADTEELAFSLTEEIAYLNSLDIYHSSLNPNMEKACQNAWRKEFSVWSWSYGIETIPIFYY